MENSPVRLINFDIALERIGGNRPLLESLCIEFIDDYRPTIEKISLLLGKGNYDNAQHLCHQIKGVAANLGMEELAEHAKELERKLKGGKKDLSKELSMLKRAFFDLQTEVINNLT